MLSSSSENAIIVIRKCYHRHQKMLSSSSENAIIVNGGDVVFLGIAIIVNGGDVVFLGIAIIVNGGDVVTIAEVSIPFS